MHHPVGAVRKPPLSHTCLIFLPLSLLRSLTSPNSSHYFTHCIPSSHLTSPHLTSSHLTSSHLISPHLTSPHSLTNPITPLTPPATPLPDHTAMWLNHTFFNPPPKKEEKPTKVIIVEEPIKKAK